MQRMLVTKDETCCCGFLTLDALFTLLPLALMISFLINVVWLSTNEAGISLERGQKFNKIVSAADYFIKESAAIRGTLKYPNLFDRNEFDKIDQELVAKRMGLK